MNETTTSAPLDPHWQPIAKDGSVHGATPASRATGDHGDATGQAQQAYDQAVDHARDFATDNPVGSLLAAAGLELVLGLIVRVGRIAYGICQAALISGPAPLPGRSRRCGDKPLHSASSAHPDRNAPRTALRKRRRFSALGANMRVMGRTSDHEVHDGDGDLSIRTC
jgi:hypothetical protein